MTAPARRTATTSLAALSTLTDRLGACADLDDVLTTTLEGLAELFGFEHSLLMMLDESGTTLFTIASRGYERAGIGSEVTVGEGIIGKVAADGAAMRVGHLQRLLAYARSALGPDEAELERAIPLPGLPAANSQLAAPATVMGQTLGVLVVESDQLGAFTEDDERVLSVVAHLAATAIELDRVGNLDRVGSPDEAAPEPGVGPRSADRSADTRTTVVRFFPVDGSTFIDGDYLIKGVAGRILWRLLSDHDTTGRTDFTNREVRLDPSLELPAFRDNLESRLVLLKRRLDERETPMRIDKTGRGRFRLVVTGTLRLERPDVPN